MTILPSPTSHKRVRRLIAGATIAICFYAVDSRAEPPSVATSNVIDGVRYGIADWPESNGNHRAVIRVVKPAEVVQVRIPWRRRDAKPEDKDIFIVDAKTGKHIDNLLRVDINREFGLLLFEPPEAAARS